MAQDFDPNDRQSWYFGPLSREETNKIFENVRTNGVFLVRESQSIRGDYVLCVREDNKISHYIVNRIQTGDSTMYRIGDQQFQDIPSLLSFYKTHYLDTTALTCPAPRLKVIAKFDFSSQDPDDLPFKKNEVLEVMSRDEDQWWTARNKEGKLGQIPVPYITAYTPGLIEDEHPPQNQAVTEPQRTEDTSQNSAQAPAFNMPKQLPAKALVIKGRIPNLYDNTQLPLQEGDIVTVTKINANGQWEGEVNNKRGIFPFTHVQFFEES